MQGEEISMEINYNLNGSIATYLVLIQNLGLHFHNVMKRQSFDEILLVSWCLVSSQFLLACVFSFALLLTHLLDFFCPKFLATKKVQVGKDQEKAQPENDSHSKIRGGKKPN